MSKLDYITVGIVALCILAIGFLVYKMTDLFNSDKPADKIEAAPDTVEVEDDDVYDYELKDEIDSTKAATDSAGQPGVSTPPATKPSTTTTTTTTPPTEKPASTTTPSANDKPATTGTSSTYSSDGKFMVIAGAFTQKSSARAEADRLKKMGYKSASVEIFDRGKYAVILVDRFDNMADAERLQKKLKADKVAAYIKLKD
jgi:cell division septation protein DedD